MNKKFVILSGILICMTFLSCSSSFAITTVKPTLNVAIQNEKLEKAQEEAEIIKNVGLKNKLQRNPEAQINSFYKKFNKYSEKNDIKKLKELYSDDFVNNDGFDKETMFKIFEESVNLYKNMQYMSEIKNITVDGIYATVELEETVKGETANVLEKINDTGATESELSYTNYLKKEDGKWKLYAADVKKEFIALKYGTAKRLDFNVTAPKIVKSGSEYEVSVKTDIPSESFLIGSIVNEEIKYPQEEKKGDVRRVTSDEFTRILKANNNNYNEYATFSLALTSADIQPDAIVIKMDGIAILLTRINVLSVKPQRSADGK